MAGTSNHVQKYVSIIIIHQYKKYPLCTIDTLDTIQSKHARKCIQLYISNIMKIFNYEYC